MQQKQIVPGIKWDADCHWMHWWGSKANESRVSLLGSPSDLLYPFPFQPESCFWCPDPTQWSVLFKNMALDQWVFHILDNRSLWEPGGIWGSTPQENTQLHILFSLCNLEGMVVQLHRPRLSPQLLPSQSVHVPLLNFPVFSLSS